MRHELGHVLTTDSHTAASINGLPLPPLAAFWKVLVATGLADGAARSSLHLLAASWLTRKLSCGRDSTYQAADRQLLTFRPVPIHTTQGTRSAVVCIEEVSVSGVSQNAPPPMPGYSCSSLAATSGLLLLVPGPPEERSEAAAASSSRSGGHREERARGLVNGSGNHIWVGARRGNGEVGEGGEGGEEVCALGEDVSAELSACWQRLRVLLEHLGRGVKIPVLAACLCHPHAAASVTDHFQKELQSWPPHLASAISMFSVVALLPSPDSALEEAVRQLAAMAPTQPRLRHLSVEALVMDLALGCLDVLNERGAQSLQAHAEAFNKALDGLSDAMQRTAESSAATWGFPPPELASSLLTAAPACWAAAEIQAVMQAIQRAKLLLSPPMQGGGATDPVLAAQVMHQRVAAWMASEPGPRLCYLLQEHMPMRAVTSVVRHLVRLDASSSGR